LYKQRGRTSRGAKEKSRKQASKIDLGTFLENAYRILKENGRMGL
jgi:type I restriction enzyme M protein